MDIGLAMQVALSTLEGIQNHAVIHVALLSTENSVRHQNGNSTANRQDVRFHARFWAPPGSFAKWLKIKGSK